MTFNKQHRMNRIERMKHAVVVLRRALVPGDADGAMIQRTVKSGVWAMLINVSDRGLQLGMTLVLAALLDPQAFGLMGIALLAVNAITWLTRLGVNEALIQQKEANVDSYLNTAWCLQVVRGVFLTAVVFSVAPLVGTAFSEPRVVPLVQAISFYPAIKGLQNPGVMYFLKNLEFHRQFVYKLTTRVTHVAVALAYGIAFRSVWALAYGFIAGAVAKVVISYVVHGYRPRPEFDTGIARELIDYGKWITGSSIVGFLRDQGDDGFVGWFLGASTLGLYQIAYRVSNAPATEITKTISTVTFPAYSKVQDDVGALREGFYRTIRTTTLVAWPAGTGLIVVAPSFVHTFFGPKWNPMILPMQVLAVFGLLHSLTSGAFPLFRAVGRPELETKLQTLKFVALLVAIYPLTNALGLAGTSLAVVCSSAIAAPVAAVLSVRIIDGRLRDLLGILAYPLVGSLVMGVCVVALRRSLSLPAYVEFPLLVGAGVVVYAAVMLALERQFGYGLGPLLTMVRDAMAA